MSRYKFPQVMSPLAPLDTLNSLNKLSDESKYFAWSYDMEQILSEKNLWKCIKYANVEMYEVFKARRQGELAINATAEQAVQFQQALRDPVLQIDDDKREKWINQDEKAKGYIGKSVGELFYPIVRNQPVNGTARDLWRAIEARCRQVNHSLWISLESEYNRATMKEHEDPREYLDRITTITNQLVTMNVIIPEARIVYKIMSTMIDLFLPLRQTIETLLRSMPEEQHTTSFLRAQFTGHTNPRKNKSHGALNVEDHTRRPSQSKFRAGIICYYCNKEGHYEKDCRLKKKEKYSRDRTRERNRNFQGNHNNNRNDAQNPAPIRNNTVNKNQEAIQGRPQLKKPSSNNAEEVMMIEEALTTSRSSNDPVWILDSGCTQHMTPNAKLLHNIQPLAKPTNVKGAMEREIKEVKYNGDAYLDTTWRIKLTNVLLVPGMRRNLIASRRLAKNGAKLVTEGNMTNVYIRGELAMQFELNEDNLYELIQDQELQECHSVDHSLNKDEEALYWHEVLGHLSVSGLKKLQDQGLINTHLKGDEHFECIACEKGKATRKPFKNVQKEVKTTKVGELIHSDLCGPITPESLTGKRYFVTYTDDFTRYTNTYFLDKKSEQIDKYREYKAMLKTQHNADIIKLRTDSGGEYTSNEFEEMLQNEGTEHESKPPRTSEWRGVSERMNRTLMDKARSMLKAKQLPIELWAAAVNYATLIRNCCETKILPKTTPYAMFFKEQPPYKRFGIFGSTVEFKDNKEKQKLDDRTITGIYLGYDRTQHCAKILDPNTSNVTYARTGEIFFHDYNYFSEQDQMRFQIENDQEGKEIIVIDDSEEDETEHTSRDHFEIGAQQPQGAEPVVLPLQNLDHPDEEPVGGQPHADLDRNQEPIVIDSDDEATVEFDKEQVNPVQSQRPIVIADDEPSLDEYRPNPENQPDIPQPGQPQRVRSSARVEVNKKLKEQKENEARKKNKQDRQQKARGKSRTHTNQDALNTENCDVKICQKLLPETDPISDEPNTYAEILEREDKDLWLAAITKEIENLYENDVFDLVAEGANPKPVTSKWVFKLKHKPDGSIEKYKARLVARGFTQEQGINFQETFAPTLRKETIRYLLNFALQNNLEVHHMDVNCAFLNGELKEDIYMRLPVGFAEQHVDPNLFKGKIAKLKKSLYGLKQAMRCWTEKIRSHLTNNGVIQSTADPSVYIFPSTAGVAEAIIAIYVDDCLIIAKPNKINEVKRILTSKFKMTDQGKLSGMLGIKFNIQKDHFTMSQSYYLENILKKFGMDQCKPVNTPVVKEEAQESEVKVDATQYRQIIGALLYMSKCTRPDTSYAVNQAARKMQEPNETNLTAVKRILRYLAGTRDYGLKYQKYEKALVGYSDASYAEQKDRKSTSGYAFLYGGAAITWSSKKQPIVAMSSMEAELIALTSTTKEAMWLRKLQTDLKQPKEAIQLLEDNQGTIQYAQDGTHNDRTKHIGVRYFFVQEKLANGEITVKYIPSTEMIADILTKPLGGNLHTKFTKMLGVSPVDT